MRVVYLDTLFFLNFFADYYLLLLTARLCGVFRKRRYLLFGAAVGAVAAVLLYFPSLPKGLSLMAQGLVCLAVTLAAFGLPPGRELLALCGTFTGLSLLSAGIMFACSLWSGERVVLRNGTVYFHVSPWTTVAGFALVWLLSYLLAGKGRARPGRCTRRVVLRQEQKEAAFLALFDSGNLLRDPASGKPVILLSPTLLEELFSREGCALIRAFYEREDVSLLPLLREACHTAFWLIPAKTAAEDRLLLVFRPGSLTIDDKQRQEYLIGIAPQPLRPDGDCRGLIGVEI